MKPWRAPLLFSLALTLACARSARAKSPEPELILGGSGSSVPLTLKLLEAYLAVRPAARLKILASIGSTGGIKAAHKGKVAVGLASRPLRPMEKTWGLTVVPYASAPLVFAVHPSVPVDGVTLESLYALYEGRQRRWPGGGAVLVVMREEGDSGAELLMERYPRFKEIFPRAWQSGIWRVEYREDDAAAAIERFKGAVGWSDAGLVKLQGRNVKILSVDGVEPSAANVLSGRYTLKRELSFVHSEGVSDEVRAFLDFVKSPEGAAVIRRHGYVPLP